MLGCFLGAAILVWGFAKMKKINYFKGEIENFEAKKNCQFIYYPPPLDQQKKLPVYLLSPPPRSAKKILKNI